MVLVRCGGNCLEGTHVKYSEIWLFLLVSRVTGEVHALVDGAPDEADGD